MQGCNEWRGLFVGKSPTTPALIRIFLDQTEYSGFQLTHAQTLEAALAEVSAARPDVVLFNDRIPSFSSYRAPLAQLLATAPTCPIVLLAEETPDDFGAQGIDRRITAVWRKADFSPHYLNGRLHQILGAWIAAA